MNYGIFGGQYVPQQLVTKLDEIERVFNECMASDEFIEEYNYYIKHYVGRPSPLYFAKNLTEQFNGAKIYLKREDLNHTGAHKINNALGQILIAKKLGKTHIIAETGAGQHGVATATVCALFKMKCTIFMGALDVERQKVNVERMRLLGAEVKSVEVGEKSLKEAVDVAFQYLLDHEDIFYLIGSAVGPHPYPKMVKSFQQIIGKEAKEQIYELEGGLPAAIIAAVGGGSNAIGIFSEFINEEVDLYGVEGAGLGLETNKHASAIINNKVGVIHGMQTYAMFDEEGKVQDAYSISSGLDYPGIGPEHAYFHESGRVIYDAITDEEAIAAFLLVCKEEGIIPALESSHAIAYAKKIASKYQKDQSIIINLSGRGDKDMHTVFNYLEIEV